MGNGGAAPLVIRRAPVAMGNGGATPLVIRRAPVAMGNGGATVRERVTGGVSPRDWSITYRIMVYALPFPVTKAPLVIRRAPVAMGNGGATVRERVTGGVSPRDWSITHRIMVYALPFPVTKAPLVIRRAPVAMGNGGATVRERVTGAIALGIGRLPSHYGLCVTLPVGLRLRLRAPLRSRHSSAPPIRATDYPIYPSFPASLLSMLPDRHSQLSADRQIRSLCG